jgi:acyl-homoserine-lactone acylase
MRTRLVALVLGTLPILGTARPQDAALPVIRRTEYGVPHILAQDFRQVGIGLGYVQVEDYGERVIMALMRSKGIMGRTFGRDSMNGDFAAARDMKRVRETFHTLDAATRGVYEGFAEGVNIFIRTNPSRVPAWARPVFHAYDVAALDVNYANTNAARNVVMRQLRADSVRARGGSEDEAINALFSRPANPDAQPTDGSNAFALAPSRTKSGRAILLRNPHLAWNAGYYEAHVTLPGQLDYYGDFRIGSAFAVIGGFNANLGWATTNNAPDNDELYAFDADTSKADAYWFDGQSAPLIKEEYSVEYSTPNGLAAETRPLWLTSVGPVVHRTRTKVFVLKTGGDGEYRAGQQFLRMMRATNLKDWKSAMSMQARPTSNITYADRAGNIFTVWNAAPPRLPLPSGRDTMAVQARGSNDVWNTIVPFDSLPQFLNPKGGYVFNSNSAPWYGNLRQPLDTLKYPPYFERPSFSLRSQNAVSIVDNTKKFSLEDVVRAKHNYRMQLADRVKADLVKAARAAKVDSLAPAIALLTKWDNNAAATSRGAVLFETWYRRYGQAVAQAQDSVFTEAWTPSKLTTTPRGIRRHDLAVEALGRAIAEVKQAYGSIDVAWGDVYRVRRGAVDVPVGGCGNPTGCFRILNFTQMPDGKRVANGGDGWVLAVEFGAVNPRAYSVLAYGQSPDSTSPYHADQAAMFARGEMKPVRFTQADVIKHAIRTYQPGRP